MRPVRIVLDGQPAVPDYPPIGFELSAAFDLETMPGGELAASIRAHRIWEGFETALFLDALARGDPDRQKVFDFGANVGWYTLIAANWDYDVEAFEAETDIAAVLRRNIAAHNDLDRFVTVHEMWVDETTGPVAADPVCVFKSDMEGNDAYAVAACRHLFEAGMIDHALIEISPCFNDSYPELVEAVCGYGYEPFCVPTKGFAHTTAFGEEPLATLHTHCRIPASARGEHVAGLWQENFWFTRRDLIR